MQAFDPRHRIEKRKPRRTKIMGIILLVSVLIFGVGYVYQYQKDAKDESKEEVVTNSSQSLQPQNKKGTFKTLTGEQFRDLYNKFAYPNTERIIENIMITGDTEADHKIKTIAEGRGYLLRSAPVTNTFKDVGNGYLLQQRAAQPWLDMKESAQKDGINLGLTAAYRSAEEQKQIFLSRLTQTGIYVPSIASGVYDNQISQVLSMTAIPGYSRHHTGYTVDISCENQPTYSFEYTVCFEWLKKDNYINAKKHGWIPSYPDGAGNQGPDPESWEYVWVGTDALME